MRRKIEQYMWAKCGLRKVGRENRWKIADNRKKVEGGQQPQKEGVVKTMSMVTLALLEIGTSSGRSQKFQLHKRVRVEST